MAWQHLWSITTCFRANLWQRSGEGPPSVATLQDTCSPATWQTLVSELEVSYPDKVILLGLFNSPKEHVTSAGLRSRNLVAAMYSSQTLLGLSITRRT